MSVRERRTTKLGSKLPSSPAPGLPQSQEPTILSSAPKLCVMPSSLSGIMKPVGLQKRLESLSGLFAVLRHGLAIALRRSGQAGRG